MKEQKNLIIKALQFFMTISLYYIVGNKNIFPYVLSLCLYNIFVSCFNHISLKDILKKIKSINIKNRILNIMLITVSIISIIFLLLNILISDIISSILNINDIFLVFIFMGLTIATEPILKLLIDYIENIKSKKIANIIYYIYHILDVIFMIIIGIFGFRILKLPLNVSNGLLYLSKILSLTIILILSFMIINNKNKVYEKYDYQKEIKKILSQKPSKSIIKIVKNSYYYISIVLLYLILSTRYGYAINEIEEIISFIYFYALAFINLIIISVRTIIKKLIKEQSNHDYLFSNIKLMLIFIVTSSIISPLICKVLYYDSSKSIYLTLMIFLSIFITLYNITFENIKNKRIIYISLIIGIISKVLLTIPLINSFYRIGYNLVYGDIVSTIISMLLSIIINYIYLKNKHFKEEKKLEKILKILYENIILCIILILFQFIIPIETSKYFKSIGLIIVYLLISIVFIKIKNEKRG